MEGLALPVKTKIAAWWMKILGLTTIVLGLCSLVLSLYFLVNHSLWYILLNPSTGGFLIVGWFAYFIGSKLLRRKSKKWWWINVNFLLLGTSFLVAVLIFYYSIEKLFENGFYLTNYLKAWGYCPTYSCNIVILISLLVPFTLFLIDRKNFWKIAA